MVHSARKYISLLEDNSGLWHSLRGLFLCRNHNDELIHHIGSSAIAFKGKLHRNNYKIRCFIHNRKGAQELYGRQYLANELALQCPDKQILSADVTIEPWREGKTLEALITKFVADKERGELARLSKMFDTMAIDLLKCSWSHGDIKPANIIITKGQKMTLIDFDSAYHPIIESISAHKAVTPSFQHPHTPTTSGKQADDYPIALISTALYALSIDPTIADRYPLKDIMLIDTHAAVAGNDAALSEIKGILSGERLAIAQLLHSKSATLPNLRELLCSANGC